MFLHQPFRFALELLKRDGASLGQVPVTVDWEPAKEAARFSALRRLGLTVIGIEAKATIQPVWNSSLGQPYVNGVEVTLSVPGAGEVTSRVPNTYFKSLATEASEPLVKKGLLKSGEGFDYLVTAFDPPPSKRAVRERSSRFSVEEVPTALRLTSSRLDSVLARSTLCGPHNSNDVPLFVPHFILQEVEALTRGSDQVEVASVLLGHVHRDSLGGDLFVEVTAQIPGREGHATSTRVTFGPATWDAAQSAVTLRGRDELMVGWVHSHPARHWCNAKCPPASRVECALQRPFFSADDCSAHRTAFAQAYQIAWLVTNSDAGLLHTLFAWRDGLIVQRGYHLLNYDSNHKLAEPFTPSAASIGEESHEPQCS